jgi:predicted dinucleotide-binding enzyme
VCFSFSRDAQKLAALARTAGPTARWGTPANAVDFGEVVLLAVPWAVVNDALGAAGAAGGAFAGKVLLDGTNPFGPDGGLAVGHTTSGAEAIARWAPGARVVKAFNTLGAIYYADPDFGGQTPSTFVASDDVVGKATARALATDLGLETADAGPLASARLLEPLAALLLRIRWAQPPPAHDVALHLLRRQPRSTLTPR